MISFLFRRCLEAILSIAVLITITFFLLHALPGGPFDDETALAPEVKAHLEEYYHLNSPVSEQFLIYVGKLFKGDLGTSYRNIDQSVVSLLQDTLPITLKLSLMSLVLSFSLGIPLGLIAASKHNSKFDFLTLFATMSCVSIPSFLLAPILILIFSFWLDWLPPALWESPSYYILPVITLAARPTALIARLIRTSALDVLHSDFVRAAYAKGMSQIQILFKHVLKNSIVPVLALSGTMIAHLISGTFVVELIFAIPGVGRHLIASVDNRDYPLVLALTLIYSFLLIIGNLIMDFITTLIDPRMRLS
ncbi:MAG: ABC transporter permease [Oligoflexia bacterium]|nr:ABC transporter permease [Oligoflexia bacterium]